MIVTGNELILAHFTPAGYIPVNDLKEYITQDISGGASNINKIQLSVSNFDESSGFFTVIVTPNEENYAFEKIQFHVIDNRDVFVNSNGIVQPLIQFGENSINPFTVLVTADGFSKMLFCSYSLMIDEMSNAVYTLTYNEDEYILPQQGE